MAALLLVALMLSSPGVEGATSSPYWIEDVNVTDSPEFETNPILGTDANGTLYLACNMLPDVGAKYIVQLRSSDDGGRTWDLLLRKGIEGQHITVEDMYVNYLGGVLMICNCNNSVLALTYPYGGLYTISSGAAFYEAAVVVEPASGMAHCVISQWDGDGGMDLLHSYAAKPWDSWSTPVTIAGGDPADHLTYGSLSLALGGNPGDLFLAYALSPPTVIHDIYVLNRTASGWEPGPGKPLATTASDEYEPSIAVFNGDMVVVAWTKIYSPFDHDIWAAYSPDYGDTFVSAPLYTSTRMERYPSLNRYFVEWSMAFLDGEAVYLSSYQGSGSWSAPQLISDADADAQPVAPSVSSYLYTYYSYYAPVPIFAAAVVWEDIRLPGNNEIRCTTYRYVRVSASASRMLIDATQSIEFTSEIICGTPPFTYEWSFDDGGSSAEPNPTHRFDVPGTYTVSVRVTDSWGYISGHSIYGIQVNPELQVSGTSNPQILDQHQTVWFTCTATNGTAPYSYLWDFGDGSSSAGPSPVHDYDVPGSFYPNVTVTDSVGMVQVWTSPLVQVNPSPTFTIDAAPLRGIVPFEVAYTCVPANGTPPYTFEWSFGDGGTSTDQNPLHTYDLEGEFTAILTMTDLMGTTVTWDGPLISAYWPLTINASADKGMVSADSQVRFNCTVEGGLPPYHFMWDFGDGNVSGEADAVHSYGQEGEFIVRLDVWDSFDPNCTANWTVLIEVSALPTVVGEVSRTELNVLQPLQFTCTVFGGRPPISYRWDFRDGNTSDQASVVHSYQAPGEYDPVLTVNDSLGAVAYWASALIKVNPLPQATISASASYGISPLTVEFMCAVVGGMPPYDYYWDMGEGAPGAGNAISYTYVGAGERLVRVMILDSAYSQANDSFLVRVYEPLVIGATVSSTVVEMGQSVWFNCTADGALPPYAYLWDFGDGNVSDERNASHSYELPGSYPVELTVRDSNDPAIEAVQLVASIRVGFDPPSAPQDLLAVAGVENVTLSWNSPLYSNASSVRVYLISYGTEPGAFPDNVILSQPFYVLTGLTKGRIYYFQVAANNTAGWGPNSTSASATPFGFPSSPTGLMARAGTSYVVLNWTAPSYIGPGTIIYHLYRNGSVIWSGIANSYNDTGIVNDRTYRYMVSAENAAGEGALSADVEAEAHDEDGNPVPVGPNDQWPLLLMAGIAGLAIVAFGAMVVREVQRKAARRAEGYVDCPRCGAEVPPQAHNCPKCNAHIRGPR